MVNWSAMGWRYEQLEPSHIRVDANSLQKSDGPRVPVKPDSSSTECQTRPKKFKIPKFRKMAMWNMVIRWVGLSGWRKDKRGSSTTTSTSQTPVEGASWRSLNAKGSLTARSYLCTANRTSPNQGDRTFLRGSWRRQRTDSSAYRVFDILVDPTSIR